jgi:hypothetical protein
VQSDRCQLRQCSPALGTYTEKCFGFCTPSERTIVAANLEDDGRTITLALNTPAAGTHFSCDKLFSTATVQKFGGAASMCSVAGSTLTVIMPGGAAILPGDGFGADCFATVQNVLLDSLSRTPFTPPSTTVALTKCDSCASPKVTMTGPKVSTVGVKGKAARLQSDFERLQFHCLHCPRHSFIADDVSLITPCLPCLLPHAECPCTL